MDKTNKKSGEIDYSGKYLFLGSRETEIDGVKGVIERFLEVNTKQVMDFVPVAKGPLFIKEGDLVRKVLGVAFMHNADEDGIYAVFPGDNYGAIRLKKVGVRKYDFGSEK